MFDSAFQAIEEAYKNKDWSNLVGAVIGVIAGVQAFRQGLPTCEAIDTSAFNFESFDASLDIAKNPLAHF